MPLPAHFFISDDGGSLHDTRDSRWASHPLRVNYRRHHIRIDSVEDFKSALRAGEHTSIGGYPLYFVMGDGEPLSFESARENFRELVAAFQTRYHSAWRVAMCDVNYEDANLYCSHSGKRIPSAYAEDDANG